MTISINLNKIEFYKEDYEDTDKIYLTGSITGLDSSKQYCVWWTCDMCPTGMYLHNGSLNYFFINRVSSVSLGSNTHLHTDDIIWSPGDYSLLGVYIIEVEGNCENYVSSVLASTSLIVYHDYEIQTGLLVCNSSPDNAEIWIDGTNTGEITPKSFTNMEVGGYNVIFKKAGYYDCSKNVTVIAGEGVSAFCNLIEMVTTGKLSCVTIPDGAEIYLNDIYYDITNKVITDLEPGLYNVKFTKDGYEDYITIKTVEAGLTTYVSKTLVPIFEPTGYIVLDKISYEQGEQVIVNWADVNFTGGMLSVINSTGIIKSQLPVNASVGTLRYTLPDDAQLGDWSVFLDYEDTEVDSKNFSVIEGCIPNWRCRQPLDGYETDINNCGEADRYNSECEPQELVDITVEVSDGINYIKNATVKIILADNPQEEKTCITSSDGECVISDLIANTSYEVNVIKMGYICTSGCGTFDSGNGGTIEVVMRETGCLKSFLPSKSLVILNEDEELILSGSVVNIDSENEQNIGIIFVRPDSIEIDKDIGLLNKCEDKSYSYNFGKVESEIIGKWFLKQCEIINEVWNVTEIASVHVVRPIESQPPIESSKKGTLLILSAAGLGTYLLTKKK